MLTQVGILEAATGKLARRSLITTVSGSAKACSRAARFGVSPSASCSCRAPPPMSPTTTTPVWMPIRTDSRACASFMGRAFRSRIAEMIPRPARTAR